MKSLTILTGGFEIVLEEEGKEDDDDVDADAVVTSSSNRLTLIFLAGGPRESRKGKKG